MTKNADHRAEYFILVITFFSMDKSVVLTQRTSQEYGFNERVGRNDGLKKWKN
jgi:hypothetical protein